MRKTITDTSNLNKTLNLCPQKYFNPGNHDQAWTAVSVHHGPAGLKLK